MPGGAAVVLRPGDPGQAVLLCPLGVQSDDMDAVVSHRRQKGQVVGLLHRVRPGDQFFGLDISDDKAMHIIRRSNAHGGKSPTAAAEFSIAGGGQDIAAMLQNNNAASAKPAEAPAAEEVKPEEAESEAPKAE